MRQDQTIIQDANNDSLLTQDSSLINFTHTSELDKVVQQMCDLLHMKGEDRRAK